MPYGRSYSKAKKAVRKVASKRFAKRVGKKVAGKFVPGYNVYSTARDIHWAGNRAYVLLKRNQVKITDDSRAIDDRPSSVGVKSRGRKRYGIDDWF